MKKNYPKNRKPFDNLVQRMLNRYGEPYLRMFWQHNGGATKASRIIADDMNLWVTELQFFYLANKFNCKRKSRPDHPIVKYVQSGIGNRAMYRHLIFPWEEEYKAELD